MLFVSSSVCDGCYRPKLELTKHNGCTYVRQQVKIVQEMPETGHYTTSYHSVASSIGYYVVIDNPDDNYPNPPLLSAAAALELEA